MMKRFAPLFLALLSSVWSFAQENHMLFDDKMDELCSMVELLHNRPDNYMDVYESLRTRDYWRLMEEFHENCETIGNMCTLWDKVELTGINDRAFQAEQARGTKPQSTDNFCAGNETRYHYSFYECRILAERYVESILSGRQGQQLFVVIPYNPGSIRMEITVNDNVVQTFETSDGYLECFISDELDIEDEIRIKVVNASGMNQSAVIINHNSGN